MTSPAPRFGTKGKLHISDLALMVIKNLPSMLNARPRPITKLLFSIACAMSLAQALQHSLPDGRLMDFGSFWDSGRAVIEGKNPYTWGQHTFIVKIDQKTVFNYNLNPPPSLLFFAPLGYIEPDLIYIPLYTISLFLFASVLFAVARTIGTEDRKLFLVWGMCLPILWDTLKLGQIYVFLAALAFYTYIAILHKQRFLGALWMGILVSVKPNFGAILLFGNSRDWIRTAIWVAATIVGINLVSASLFGFDVYIRWYEAVTRDISRLAFPTNISIPGIAFRLTNTPVAWIVTPICLVAGLYLVRNTTHLQTRLKIGFLVSILASPIGWVHYLLVSFPVFIKFRIDNLGLLIMTLYLAPISSVVGSYYQGSALDTLMSFSYPIATLLLLYKIARAPRD